jgi:hypothetical protein
MHVPIQCPRPITQALHAYITGLKQDPNGIEHLHTVEKDLREFWYETIVEETNKYIDLLDQVLSEHLKGKPGKEDGLEIKDDQVDDVLRACSAIRLFLRRTALKDISDERLENMEIEEVTLEVMQAISCYIYLASLQTLIIDLI